MAAATTLAQRGLSRATYWIITAVVVAECAIGGARDLLRAPPFYPMMLDLGYPAYLATILGVAKILAAVALLVPDRARLKEWAYAGVVINMIGAAASWVAIHSTLDNIIPPLVFAGLAFASSALRPPSRRL